MWRHIDRPALGGLSAGNQVAAVQDDPRHRIHPGFHESLLCRTNVMRVLIRAGDGLSGVAIKPYLNGLREKADKELTGSAFQDGKTTTSSPSCHG
ncbi:MAG: hypothetical protein ACTIDY_15475 [Halomonadaceae bacterium]|uniref:hypothetical protein n=1 Tax=Halomonas sp. AOP7-B1-5 TaxID=3457642 RepID=UPI003FB72439